MSRIKPGTMCLIRGSTADDDKIVEAIKFFPAGDREYNGYLWTSIQPAWAVKGKGLSIFNVFGNLTGYADERLYSVNLLIPISDPDSDVSDVVTEEHEKEYV